MFDALVPTGRAAAVHGPAGGHCGARWSAGPRSRCCSPTPRSCPDHPCPVAARREPPDEDAAAADLLRGHLDVPGPVHRGRPRRRRPGCRKNLIVRALARLRGGGLRAPGPLHRAGRQPNASGVLRPAAAGPDPRLHPAAASGPRSSRSPPGTSCGSCCAGSTSSRAPSREGRFGVLAVIEQLQGFELAAGRLGERGPGRPGRGLPPRVAGRAVPVRPGHLGTAVGARRPQPDPVPRRSGADPVPGHPDHPHDPRRPALAAARRAGRARPRPSRVPAAPATSSTRCAEHGALFRPDLATVTGRLPAEVEEALWDGVARGLVTADGFRAVRSLLRRGGRRRAAAPARPAPRHRRRPAPARTGAGACCPPRPPRPTGTSWPRPSPSSSPPAGA